MEWSTTILTLILIGGAIIALFVFVSAARLYVSPPDDIEGYWDETAKPERRGSGTSGRYGDRRKNDEKVEFPLRLGNLIIEHDRRRSPDRRQGMVH